MPIVNKAIKEQVSALLEATKVLEQKQSEEQFAQGIADIIEAALKSAVVTVQPGIAVSTAGSATTQTGTTTGTGTGSLS